MPVEAGVGTMLAALVLEEGLTLLHSKLLQISAEIYNKGGSQVYTVRYEMTAALYKQRALKLLANVQYNHVSNGSLMIKPFLTTKRNGQGNTILMRGEVQRIYQTLACNRRTMTTDKPPAAAITRRS